MTDPLSKLSDREKTLLGLLAQGHTVKSAAAITGDTENAANELLRSARRKLDVGSSREAARLFVASDDASQKNCDEISGIEPRPSRSLTKRQLVMGGCMFATILTVPALFLMTQSSDDTANAAINNDRPRVVSTFPNNGAVIPAGPFEMTITYDRPMLDQHAIFPVPKDNNAYLACIGEKGAVRQSEDRKSFIVSCDARPGLEHAIRFGSAEKGYFKDTDWHPAVPFVLSFAVAQEDASNGPRVVATSPATGTEIEPGPFRLSVTYDRPMAPASMSFATGPKPAFPDCAGPAKQSDDGKTYSIECTAKPGANYTVWFNYGEYMGFRAADSGKSAQPHGIIFSVKN